jgi:hypothetical protein
MRTQDEETELERRIKRLKNQRVVSLVLLIGVAVIAIGTFTAALQKIWDFSRSVLLSRQEPSRNDAAKPSADRVASKELPPSAHKLPLETKWEGIWQSARGSRFSFVMHLNIASDDTANGYILWRLLQVPPDSPLADRVNEPGTEFVRGSINRETGEVALAGYKVDNPTLLALDRYQFFISSDGRNFRGLSQDTDGSWQTAINGVFSIVKK